MRTIYIIFLLGFFNAFDSYGSMHSIIIKKCDKKECEKICKKEYKIGDCKFHGHRVKSTDMYELISKCECRNGNIEEIKTLKKKVASYKV
uniref:Uncharacterized protein n=1 Tax=Strongyloides papillosus TaxID=174720 RepID=A0A0N5C6C2_STREA